MPFTASMNPLIFFSDKMSASTDSRLNRILYTAVFTIAGRAMSTTAVSATAATECLISPNDAITEL